MFLCLAIPSFVLAAEGEGQLATQESALSVDGNGGETGPLDPTDRGGNLFNGVTLPSATAGPSGALTQSVPIVLLPDRSASQPPLRLSYSSRRNTEGIVGYGWELDWVSLIRAGHRNGPTDPDLFKSDDLPSAHRKFRLEVWGQQMELVYLKGKTLGPRYENWWRVHSANANTFDGWVAKAPNGYRYQFTNPMADELTNANKKSDTNVRFIDAIISPDEQSNTYFEYKLGTPYSDAQSLVIGDIPIGDPHFASDAPSGVQTGTVVQEGPKPSVDVMRYPARIEYGCPSRGHATCYVVDFVYEARPKPHLHVKDGQLVVLMDRLVRLCRCT